jgi:hypothetical protein
VPKRKEPELKPAEQFKRFRETAKRHGLDGTGEELEVVFKKLATTTRKTSKSPKQES